MIVSSNQIDVKSAKLEGAIAQILKIWAMAYPDELVALDEMVGDLRRNAARSSMVTNDGNMMLKAEIPVTLHAMLQKGVHQDWLTIPEVRNEVFSQFRVGMVNRSSVSWR